MPIPEHEPLPATTPASPSPPATATAASGPAPPPGKWGPYSCAADFTTNMAAILVALFCVLILAVAANAFARHFLRRRRRAVGLPVAGTGCKEVSKISIKAIPMPVLVFSRRETSLAGDGPPECAICLSEFADGDRVRVIPACNHGFHVSCVETWLVSRPSCPTCRSSCKADAGDSGNSAANHACRVAEPMRRSSTVEERATTVPSPEDRATMEEP